MPMRGTLSVLGLYSVDKSLFDGLTIPNGMIRDVLIPLILADCSELETVYPDAGFFKQILSVWSQSRLPAWERVYNTLTQDYDPLANYDRHEDWTDTGSGANEATDTVTSTSTETVSAFNSDEMSPRSGESRSGTNHSNQSGTTTSSHVGTIKGNIGVTTSQQMVREELALRKVDPYQYIVDEFKQRFCVLVY